MGRGEGGLVEGLRDKRGSAARGISLVVENSRERRENGENEVHVR